MTYGKRLMYSSLHVPELHVFPNSLGWKGVARSRDCSEGLDVDRFMELNRIHPKGLRLTLSFSHKNHTDAGKSLGTGPVLCLSLR